MKSFGWITELQQLDDISGNISFVIQPKIEQTPTSAVRLIVDALLNPIGTLPLAELVHRGDTVLILADDLTRPTPRHLILPHVLNEINKGGVADKDIRILIALGTHRSMNKNEIFSAFGTETVERVSIFNHDFRNTDNLVNIGLTKRGTPISVNRLITEANLVIGVGSIVPHPEAGWSGGAKILQPGICGAATTSVTHMMAARVADQLALAGTVENPIRYEMESVAQKSGLRFIVNVIFDGSGNVIKVVAGDPVKAHRVGVKAAKVVFVREIPNRADVVIVDSTPADIDYWQGIKPLSFATRALKSDGTTILVGRFPDRISPIHKDFSKYSLLKVKDLLDEEKKGSLTDGICTEALLLHAKIRQKSPDIICVSRGLTLNDKTQLGFRSADTVLEAVRMAQEKHGNHASIGIILNGGDVLPAKSDKE